LLLKTKFVVGHSLRERQELQVVDGRCVEIDAELLGHLQLPVVELAEAGRADQAKDIGLLRVHGGPAQVLDYLGRYTHQVAISNDRLRYYGLLSNRDRAQKLAQCRELIGQMKPGDSEPQLPADWKSRYHALTGESLETCPLCRVGRMVCIETIPASVRWPTRRRVKPVVDSS